MKHKRNRKLGKCQEKILEAQERGYYHHGSNSGFSVRCDPRQDQQGEAGEAS